MKVEVSLERANRLLNPGCVVFVTAEYGGRRNFMPAAWVSPVSHKPPLCCVAVAPKRFTHDLIAKSGHFGLAVPGSDLLEKVRRAGDISGADVPDKFTEIALTPSRGRKVSAPRIEECLANIECELVKTVTTGDHTLFVGRVVAAEADPRAFDETWLLPEERALRPVHHLGGEWFAVLESRLFVPKHRG